LWGQLLSKWRYFVCLPLIAILPVSLLADDTAGMLRSNGIGVLVNKNPAPASIALFPDALIETQAAAVARIEETGSSADINPETMVEYQTDELVLDHGSLSVNTSRGLRVRIGCLTITPANGDQWTHYDVVDVDGKVTVSALKNDVNIDARSRSSEQAKQPEHSNRITVREGERKSREDKCGGDFKSPQSSGGGPFMDSPYVKWSAVGIIGVLTCWALCRNTDANPLSPAAP
jgi:hypothetical protein